MRVDLNDLRLALPSMTEEQIYNEVNALAVGYWEFAQQTSLYGRAYGVLDDAFVGPEWTVQNAREPDYVLNVCMRNALWRSLLRIQKETESHMGFNFSERYHEEELMYRRTYRMQTEWPGVEALQVKQSWAAVEGLSGIVINPFYLSGIAHTGAQILLPIADVPNFYDVFLVNTGSYSRLALDETLGLLGTKSGDSWVIPINTTKTPLQQNVTVDVLHRQYVRVVVTPPETVPNGYEIHPVYSGTNQIIPQARPLEILDNGDYRYTFFVHSLIDPSFAQRTVYWNHAETYKLAATIDFKYRFEEPAYVKFIWKEGNETKEFQFDPSLSADVTQNFLKLDLTMQHNGVFTLYIDDGLYRAVRNKADLWYKDVPETAKIVLNYKTNPSLLRPVYKDQIASIIRAIVYRVAASLPMTDCDCETSTGFIANAQKSYVKQTENTYTGSRSVEFKYGEEHGNVLYRQTLANATAYSKPTNLAARGW